MMTMTGFLDGINDSLKEANPNEEMEEDTKVSLAFDKELLYKNMVAAGADWLYELPEWEEIFDEDKRKELYREQKLSMSIYEMGYNWLEALLIDKGHDESLEFARKFLNVRQNELCMKRLMR